MLFIIIILLLLSIILFNYTKVKEGLDESCPVLNQPTTGGIANQAHIISIQKDINDINNMKTQITTNTTALDNLNLKLKNAINIKQNVDNLDTNTKKLSDSITKLGESLQSHGLSLANTNKKNMSKPLPYVQANASTGFRRTL